MLTAMLAALAVLTPPGFEAPASRSVARLGTHAGGEVSANATKTALRAPPNLWGTELATHVLRVQTGSATMCAAPLDACQHDCDGQPEQEEQLRVFNTEFKAARTAARAQHSARNK